MAVTERQGERRRPEWLKRLVRIGPVIAATALVFVLLIAIGTVSGPEAIAGFLLIVVAAAIAVGGEEVSATAIAEQDAAVRRADDPLLQAVLDGLPDPVVALDRTGSVLAFNPKAGALAPGLRRGEHVSLAMRTPELLEAVRRAASGSIAQRIEISERAPLDRWLEAIVAPLSLGEGAGAGVDLVLLTFHDLTPLRRVEEMRADFVANASHELRTPLAALLGFIETLQGPAREDTAARERFLGIMHTQGTRMARVIDDLLSLSRIELNADRRPEKRVDVIAIVRQVADSLQTLARDRGVEIVLQTPDTPLPVLGDRDELTRACENLVENALKYGASGKRVELTVARQETASAKEEATIAVRDFGPGIAPEHMPRLTERFYRVDVADSRAQGGTGLGLALVKHILRRHGGRLDVASIRGEGATFTMHLPLAASEK